MPLPEEVRIGEACHVSSWGNPDRDNLDRNVCHVSSINVCHVSSGGGVPTIANVLETNEELIKVENDADVEAAQLVGYEKSLVSRLVLKPGRISSFANSIRVLANMEEPIDHVLKRTKVADGLILEKMPCPLGVLLIVFFFFFESQPDALVQMATLAIRSGNILLLKTGKKAKRSNAILHKVITKAISDSVGKKLIGLVTSREEIPDLLKLDDVIDLIIPRGNNNLVFQIKDSIKIPVLDHAGKECFMVRMTMVGGFWMRGGEAPSVVKR